MKELNPAFAAHIADGTTTLAWCWKITRRDGVVMGFTDHDLQLSFGGLDYEPESGFTASEIRGNSDMGVDAQDAQGALSSGRITEADIRDGLWDGAAVELWRVNWSNPAQRQLMRKGAIGEVRRGRMTFTAEIRSMAHTLAQTVGRTYQLICDAALGDGRCKVDLESPAFKGTGTVTSVLDPRRLTVSGLNAFATGLFDGGVLTWTSGPASGRRVEVMIHTKGGGVTMLHLAEIVGGTPPAGATFVIRAGCDKRIGTCSARFDNVVNFRGFPNIPGQDVVVRYASRGRHGGGTL